MKRDFNHRATEDTTETWLTPPEIMSALGAFDLDPCCPPDMPWRTATYLNHQGMSDGLAMEWPASRRVWLNPPYGNKTFDWMEKLAHHKLGVALIFARTETAGFHREIWQKAHSIFFFKVLDLSVLHVFLDIALIAIVHDQIVVVV